MSVDTCLDRGDAVPMRRPIPRTRRLLLSAVAACLVAAGGAAFAATVAQGRASDDTILSQQSLADPVGDEASNGPDLSNLILTTYADQSLGMVVQYANRGLLLENETIQIFLDLDDNGRPDLNFSLWPSGSISYLARWNGSSWATVRQLPEATQAQGSYSVRLPLSVLRDSAGIPVAARVGVLVASYTFTGTSATFSSSPSDWLPNSEVPVQQPTTAQATTTTTAPATTAPAATTPKPPASHGPLPKLTLSCAKHALHATVTPPKGTKIVFVTFAVNGNARSTDTRSPFGATVPAKSLRPPIRISAAVHFATRTQTVQKTYTTSC
jgi:hypothetical protein